MEISDNDQAFLAFIGSLKPSLIQYIQTTVNSKSDILRDQFLFLSIIFKVDLNNLTRKIRESLSVVLAALIYDYLAIGIVTLSTDQKVQDLLISTRKKLTVDQKEYKSEDAQNQRIFFLSTVIAMIQDKNPEIPYFHSKNFPLEKLIKYLIKSNDISQILFEFYLKSSTSPFIYTQMKTPRYFELGIGWNQKQQHGQVFTPKIIIDFICSQVVNHETEIIIDPAAGTGLFLLGALQIHHKHSYPVLKTFIGIEKDPILSILCESNLKIYCKLHSISDINCQVFEADFFNCDQKFLGIANEKRGSITILMNPPYTRQELLSNEFKAFLRQKINSTKVITDYKKHSPSFQVSGQSSLYIYFILYISEFLHQKDQLGLIIPNSWLDVKFGAKFQNFLLEHYFIDLILSTRLEKLFLPVDVNTSIITLRYKGYTSSSELTKSSHRIKFVTIDNRSDLDLVSSYLGNEYPNGFKTINKVEKSEHSLIEEEKWGLYLKAPMVYFTLMDRLQTELIELGEVASIRRGFTSGANDFFYIGKPGFSNNFFTTQMDPKTGNLLLTPKNQEIQEKFQDQGFFFDQDPIFIEKEYWMHPGSKETEFNESIPIFFSQDNNLWIPNYLVKSPKEIKGFSASEVDLTYTVLMIPAMAPSQLKPGIKRYIFWGENWKPANGKTFDQRRTCSSRKFWFSLPAEEYHSYPLLCIMTINDRYPFFYNPQNYYFDARLYGINPNYNTNISQEVLTKFLFLFLNSIFVSLQLELLGRGNLGEGGLDVKVYEYNNVRIFPLKHPLLKTLDSLDHYFSLLLENHPLSILEKKNSQSRTLLDEFLVVNSILSNNEIKQVHSALDSIVQARLDKARSITNQK